MQLPEVLGGTSLSRKAPVKISIDTIRFQAVLDNLEAFIKQWREFLCGFLHPDHLPEQSAIEYLDGLQSALYGHLVLS